MASATSICSNALLMLGASPINDLVAEEGEQAVLALNLFESARDTVIRSHNWSSCIKRVILAPLAAEPVYATPVFGYQYQIPSDCLRVLSVGDYYQVEHKIEGNKILANNSSLPVRYLYRNDDVGSWDAGLVDVMTAYMAAQMAYPITRSASMMQAKQQEYLMTLRRARAADSQQGTSDPLAYSSPLLAVRGV